MNFQAEGYLQVHIQNQIATLEFGHPASNAFTTALLRQFTEALHKLSENPQVHVIVINSSENRSFCAGASLDELLEVTTLEESIAFFSGFAHALNAMRTCKKIIVTRVHGKAVGGGLGIIAASDYVIATQAASVKLAEISIGIGPFVIAPALERKIGKAPFLELSLTPTTWKSASWANEKGLYAAVFETLDAANQAVSDLAQQLALYHPEALMQLKKVSWEDAAHWDTMLTERARMSATLALSEFTKEALARFKK